MNSCLYEGTIRHRRYAPRRREFRYRSFSTLLDLDELDEVFRGRWLWRTRPGGLAVARFDRRHYLGDPAIPLAEAVRERVRAETGRAASGPIRLLTHLSYWGFCFNPVSFYYLLDAAGERVETIVAEITNTPWDERHAYVLDARAAVASAGDGGHRWKFGKAFHVSPFLDMDYEYDWRFTAPGESLTVHMENRRGDALDFDATLTLRRRPIDGRSLASVLVRHPFETGKTVAAIYAQAARLWLGGAKVFDHPGRRADGAAPAPT